MGAAGPTCGPRLGTRAERLLFAVRCSRFAVHVANLGVGTVSNRVGKSPGGRFQRSVPYDTSCKSVQGRCGGPFLYIPMPRPPCKLRVLLSHRHVLRHGILQAAWQSLIEMGNARMACWETGPYYQPGTECTVHNISSPPTKAHNKIVVKCQLLTKAAGPIGQSRAKWSSGRRAPRDSRPIMALARGGPDNFLPPSRHGSGSWAWLLAYPQLWFERRWSDS